MKLFLLTMALGIATCTAQTKKATFTGNAKDLAGDTIYLKKYTHFDYLEEDYIIDSAIVDKDGNFQLEMNDSKERLVILSVYDNEPPSYQIFRKNPDHYYYSFCMNFFGREPTVYSEGGKNYTINYWDTSNNDDSVQFEDEYQNKLRSYYRNIDYRGVLADENRQLLDLTSEEAWARIIEERDEKLSSLYLNEAYPVESVEHYLKTEVILGAVNDFLIWYNNKTDGRVDSDFYQNLMNNYIAEQWNPHSVEYYKLTERFISYKLNLKHNKRENYFPPSTEKVEFAKKFAGENIKDKYISNLSTLLERS